MKLCDCGCGLPAPIAAQNSPRDGRVKGQPVRYISGHNTPPLSERFWTRVDMSAGPDACWPWTGATNGEGRGRIMVDKRLVYAYRIAWELTNGEPFPDGLQGCHKCDNPICVNPQHIFPGTHTDNSVDMMRKGRGRSPRGALVPPELVRQAVAEYVTGTESLRSVAARYGVSGSSLLNWVRGRHRTHDALIAPEPAARRKKATT